MMNDLQGELRPALKGSHQPGLSSADRQEAPCQGELGRDPGGMEGDSGASGDPAPVPPESP